MSFRQFVSFGLVLAFSVFTFGCAAQQQSQQPKDQNQPSATESGGFESAEINAPSWFFEPPERDGSMLVAASGQSTRMDVAIDKATLSAKREIAGNIRSTLEGQSERYVEEIGDSSNPDETVTREQYQDFTREMVAEELQGIRTVEKAVAEEESGYRAFVLVELTMDDIREQLSDKEELKTRFNAKQFEEDMDKNLKNLREQRKQEMGVSQGGSQ